MASASVVDVRPDFDAINAGIEAAASADYMDTVNTEIVTWVEDNEYDNYYDASRDVVGSDVANLDDDVARAAAAHDLACGARERGVREERGVRGQEPPFIIASITWRARLVL